MAHVVKEAWGKEDLQQLVANASKVTGDPVWADVLRVQGLVSDLGFGVLGVRTVTPNPKMIIEL